MKPANLDCDSADFIYIENTVDRFDVLSIQIINTNESFIGLCYHWNDFNVIKLSIP